MLTLFKVDTFDLRNPWFCNVKPMLSDRKTRHIRTWGQKCINIQKWIYKKSAATLNEPRRFLYV